MAAAGGLTNSISDILQDDGDAECAQHGRKPRRAPQRAIGGRLDADAQEADRDEGHDEDREDREHADHAAGEARRRGQKEEGRGGRRP